MLAIFVLPRDTPPILKDKPELIAEWEAYELAWVRAFKDGKPNWTVD